MFHFGQHPEEFLAFLRGKVHVDSWKGDDSIHSGRESKATQCQGMQRDPEHFAQPQKLSCWDHGSTQLWLCPFAEAAAARSM